MLELYCIICVVVVTGISLCKSRNKQGYFYQSSVRMLGGAVGYLTGRGFHYDDNFIILFGLLGCFYGDWLFSTLIPRIIKRKVNDFENNARSNRNDSD